MRFPNAFEGTKKIYKAAIMELIILAVSVVLDILGRIFTDLESPVLSILLLIVAVGLLILGIVAFVFELLGTKKGSEEEKYFLYAFYTIIATLCLSVLGSLLNKIDNNVIATFGEILVALSRAGEALSFYFIVYALVHIGEKLDNLDMQISGKRVVLLMVIAYAAVALTGLLAAVFNSETMALILGIVTIIATILAIIATVLYYLYLKKSLDILENAKVEDVTEDVSTEETQTAQIEE